MPPFDPANPANGLNLTNTLIVSYDDDNAIINLDAIDEILDDTTVIKMVVLGPRPDVVLIADDLAESPAGAVRKVIWFVKGLADKYSTMFDIGDQTGVQAFSLGLHNNIGTIINANKLVTYISMNMAYYATGL